MVNNFGRRDSNVDEGSVSLGVGVAAGVVDEGMLRFLEGGNRRLRQAADGVQPYYTLRPPMVSQAGTH